MIKFFVQWDGRYRSRAYKNANTAEFEKVNHAIDRLKRQAIPYKLCFREVGSDSVRTLMRFEAQKGIFTDKKKASMVQVGPLMYVPKGLVRKTTQKRKRRCKKSKNSTGRKAFVKSTKLDFSSPS